MQIRGLCKKFVSHMWNPIMQYLFFWIGRIICRFINNYQINRPIFFFIKISDSEPKKISKPFFLIENEFFKLFCMPKLTVPAFCIPNCKKNAETDSSGVFVSKIAKKMLRNQLKKFRNIFFTILIENVAKTFFLINLIKKCISQRIY